MVRLPIATQLKQVHKRLFYVKRMGVIETVCGYGSDDPRNMFRHREESARHAEARLGQRPNCRRYAEGGRDS